MNPRAAILLATYNGERFLPEQLASLAGQTDRGFVILARDDGSIDDTPRILDDFSSTHPGLVERIGRTGTNLGPARAFAILLETALADPRRFDTFMFCDQDDVWLPEKVARLRRLLDTERARTDTPLLVHSDMRVVSEDLSPVAPSFWRRQGIDPTGGPIQRLLVKNCVTGHACILNRALAETACPVPQDIVMHDWWLALAAAATGRIVALNEPLSLYRQHPQSVEGSRPGRIRRLLSPRHWNQRILRRGQYDRLFRQAERFLERFGDRLPDNEHQIRALTGISEGGYIGRRARLIRSGVYPGNPWDYADLLIKA